MLTTSLQGNLLSFYVALALGCEKTTRFWAPWDDWCCDIMFEGRSFGPFDTEDAYKSCWMMADLHHSINDLKIGTSPTFEGKWQVGNEQKFVTDTIYHGYALAIVYAVFGDTVPDSYECPNFKKHINLLPYNIPYGDSPGFDVVVEVAESD